MKAINKNLKIKPKIMHIVLLISLLKLKNILISLKINILGV